LITCRSFRFACNLALALSALVPGLSFAEPASARPRSRVILQYATTAERDAAFTRLLDRGAAVRVADSGAGPALVAIGSAALIDSEAAAAIRMSLDASVSITSELPARGARVNRSRGFFEPIETNRTRAGFAVAIIDSGIQPHADLPLSRIRAFEDFVDGSPTPVDGCGHGTHVAGVIAGNGRSSDGDYAGIAPTVDIVSLRVLGDDCSGNTSDVIDALEWIGRNHELYRIKVVNLSLGHAVLEPIFTDPLVQAVERLARKGVTVVTAAGNRGINPATGRPGYGGAGVPCNAPSAICVGSLDTFGSIQLDDDRVTDSSSRGPTRFDLLAKPDLVAPGINVVSLAAMGSRLFTEFPENRVAGANGEPRYFVLSGTSMASPVVAAAAALLLQSNPALSTNALKLALQFTARIVAGTDVLTQGAGALNIPGAALFAAAINTDAPHGVNWIRHRLTAANVDAFGQFIAWGQRIIYGDRFMQPRYAQVHLMRWDDDIVWAYDAIADNIVWGNAGDNIVWGNDDNIVWGNSRDDNIVWGNGELRSEWKTETIEGFWWGK
jgi:serine protease AprX